MPGGVSAAAVTEAGDVADEDVVWAEGVSVGASGRWLGDPLPSWGSRWRAEHSSDALLARPVPFARRRSAAIADGERGALGRLLLGWDVVGIVGMCERRWRRQSANLVSAAGFCGVCKKFSNTKARGSRATNCTRSTTRKMYFAPSFLTYSASASRPT